MLRVAHASHTGRLYLVEVDPPAGIMDLVRDTQLETYTAQDRITFWFTRSTNRAFSVPNEMAIELLLSTTEFTARDVPMLRANVVITSLDATGQPAALTDQQVSLLSNTVLSSREQRVLTRRIYRDMRSRRRRDFRELNAYARTRTTD